MNIKHVYKFGGKIEMRKIKSLSLYLSLSLNNLYLEEGGNSSIRRNFNE